MQLKVKCTSISTHWLQLKVKCTSISTHWLKLKVVHNYKRVDGLTIYTFSQQLYCPNVVLIDKHANYVTLCKCTLLLLILQTCIHVKAGLVLLVFKNIFFYLPTRFWAAFVHLLHCCVILHDPGLVWSCLLWLLPVHWSIWQ